MLKALSYAAQALILGLASYTVITSLWGWRSPGAVPRGSRSRRLRVVIPAHDEERVVGALLADLAGQDYPDELFSVDVVADRHEATAAAARAAPGPNQTAVLSRTEGPDGKGAALAWYLEQRPLQPDEALIVLDADNRVPPGLLAGFADELDTGRQAIQAYLDVTNPDESLLTTASAVSYWAGNRMVQLARSNLGWSADLGGTGMCLSASALAVAGGFKESQTEDVELGVRLARAGVPVHWAHGLRIRDEKPPSAGRAIRQRARWTAGRRMVARRNVAALLKDSIRRRSPGLFDLAVRLVQPGRSFVALLSALLAVAAPFTDLIWPWPIWAAAALVQFLLPVAFLIRDGIPSRYLIRYPVLVLLPVLWLPIRVVSRITAGRWDKTPHRGE